MDHKSWLWRKRSSEKTIVVSTERVAVSTRRNEEEACEKDKTVELAEIVKDLNEKLSSALSESKSKDDIVKQHAKVAEDAIAGWEKAESEAMSFKQGLDNALQRAADAEDRATHLDGALKECMKQLRHVREEQEQRIHDAISKVTREYEREKIKLEEKLDEANKEAVELHAEDNRLNKIIQVKEKLIEEIKERSLQAEANFSALSVRLNSAEKLNSTLKYELCVLEKELEIRNEEKEYNRRSADASQKQQLESMKKITKLETECQKLRLLVRKRLPGPAAVAQMKNEVVTLGKDSDEWRRKRFNHAQGAAGASDQETINKRFVFLTERMSAMEEETKVLRETLAKKNHELQSSRILCSRTMSKLSQVEAQILQLIKGQDELVPTKSACASVISISEDGGNDYENSSAESWASALISELEQFRSGKAKGSCKSFGTSELSLMDDFLEMEQLAIVSVDKPLDNSNIIQKEEKLRINSAAETIVPVTKLNGKELVPFSENGVHSKCIQKEKSPEWLLNLIRGVLLDHVVERNAVEILESIRVALNVSPYLLPVEIVEVRTPSGRAENLDPSCTKSCPSSRSPPPISPRTDSYSEDGENLFPKDKRKQLFSPKLSKSISKVISIIEGAMQASQIDAGNQQSALENANASLPYKNPIAVTGYTVRVIQWQISELNVVLQGFVEACNNLLQEKIGIEKFASKLCSTLDWIVDHCFSLQDVSSMKDMIKKRLDYDVSLSETESEIGGMDTPKSHPKSTISEKSINANEAPASDLSGFQDDHDGDHLRLENKPKLLEEVRNPSDDFDRIKPEKQDAEDGVQLVINHKDSLKDQIHQSDQQVSSLELELTSAVGANSLTEDQLKNHKLLNENLQKKLSAVKDDLSDAHQKLSFLQDELEDKTDCVQTLEATCQELQFQLESAKKKETISSVEETDKRLRTDLEISVASERLAECQETILNLGKQLKALASPKDAALLDKVIPFSNHRLSLLDQMLADDETKTGSSNSPKTKEIICTTASEQLPATLHSKTSLPPTNTSQAGLLYGWKLVNADHNHEHDETTAEPLYQSTPVRSPGKYFGSVEKRRPESRSSDTSLAIVPRRNAKGGGGGGFLKKLLLRKRRPSSKKSFSVA